MSIKAVIYSRFDPQEGTAWVTPSLNHVDNTRAENRSSGTRRLDLDLWKLRYIDQFVFGSTPLILNGFSIPYTASVALQQSGLLDVATIDPRFLAMHRRVLSGVH